jgi:Ca-activated chloride channel family protein
MKEIFDRHQEKLTTAERHAIWRTLAAPRVRKSRAGLGWALSTAAAGLAAGVFALTSLNREPAAPPASSPTGPGGSSSRVENAPSSDHRVDSADDLPQTQQEAARPAEPPAVPGLQRHEEFVVLREGAQPDPRSEEAAKGSSPAPTSAPPASGGSIVLQGKLKDATTLGQRLTPSDEVEKGESRSSLGLASPPVIPTTGGTALPNDETYDSMFFRNYGVNPFIPTDEDALSTFAVDVDAASYTVVRRYIELGNLPPADAVRVEEFVNFFPQGYPRFENEDFRILIDGAPSPFGPGYHLLRIGLKGREIGEWDRKPAALTFVIDVSGSMGREDRLGLVKQALRLLVDRLRDDDRVGIVVYGSRGRVLLEPTALGESDALAREYRRRSDDFREEEPEDWRSGRRRILEAIDRLHPEGSTNAEEGLLLGYEMARRGYRPKAINRIVLCSDGVANVGRTGPQSILERVRTEADRGIHLSTIGFGMGNYNDVLMERLADKGDGNYYYVDDLDEARRVLVENLTGTLQTIARDAKIQVEFHPSRVLRYRLLGFENRDVADRDFRNDQVDAGEIGAGHEVTALYEVKLAPQARRGPIATVRLRYARPEHDGRGAPQVREIAKDFRSTELRPRFERASAHFRLDAAVAEFAEILRGSYWAKESRLSDVLPVARDAARDLRQDAADEFVSLVERAAELGESPDRGEYLEER